MKLYQVIVAILMLKSMDLLVIAQLDARVFELDVTLFVLAAWIVIGAVLWRLGRQFTELVEGIMNRHDEGQDDGR